MFFGICLASLSLSNVGKLPLGLNSKLLYLEAFLFLTSRFGGALKIHFTAATSFRNKVSTNS